MIAVPFSTEIEALAWLGGIRRRGERLNATDPRVLEVLHEAVRYVGTLQFDDVPIERLLIAEASGLLPAAVDALLDEVTGSE